MDGLPKSAPRLKRRLKMPLTWRFSTSSSIRGAQGNGDIPLPQIFQYGSRNFSGKVCIFV